jgi:hypothetical protein
MMMPEVFVEALAAQPAKFRVRLLVPTARAVLRRKRVNLFAQSHRTRPLMKCNGSAEINLFGFRVQELGPFKQLF